MVRYKNRKRTEDNSSRPLISLRSVGRQGPLGMTMEEAVLKGDGGHVKIYERLRAFRLPRAPRHGTGWDIGI